MVCQNLEQNNQTAFLSLSTHHLINDLIHFFFYMLPLTKWHDVFDVTVSLYLYAKRVHKTT